MVQETNVYVSKIKNMSSFLIKINVRRKKNKFPKKMYFTSSVWYGTGVKKSKKSQHKSYFGIENTLCC